MVVAVIDFVAPNDGARVTTVGTTLCHVSFAKKSHVNIHLLFVRPRFIELLRKFVHELIAAPFCAVRCRCPLRRADIAFNESNIWANMQTHELSVLSTSVLNVFGCLCRWTVCILFRVHVVVLHTGSNTHAVCPVAHV